MNYYIRVKDKKYPLTEMDIKKDNPTKSFDENFSNIEGYQKVIPSEIPEYDSLVYKIIEINPIQFNNKWHQKWEIVNLTNDEILEEKQKRVNNLWNATNDYQNSQISGTFAASLILGVLQNLPKCVEVKNWINSLWKEYYVRKSVFSADTDFTIFGKIPFPVPELTDEIMTSHIQLVDVLINRQQIMDDVRLEIKNISSDVITNQDEKREFLKSLENSKVDIDSIRTEINNIKKDFEDFKTDLTNNIQTDLSNIRKDFEDFKIDLDNIKKDFADSKIDVDGMKKVFTDIIQNLVVHGKRITTIESSSKG